ncbi:MAG: LacI family DNA-binding transcriptional regulator [Lentisphaerae bacterium]|nr:LacI family DNA-binding transcriptional regulator [Lentisphaerota bacterium]
MKQQKLNIRQFALKLGISTATVSRAFGTKGRISDITRRMIKAKAEQMGYRANYHASNLIGRRTHTVAFFYPPLVKGEPDYFITEIVFGVNSESSRQKMPLQIHSLYPESMDFCKDVILNGSISGIIVIEGSPESSGIVKTAKSAGLPYIVIGNISGERGNTVTFDKARGAMLAGQHFRDCGRKKPAYIGGLSDKKKREGFKAGLGRLSSKLLIDNGGSTFLDGFNSFERIVKTAPETDCVLCANDILAIGFIKAALAAGRKIPDEIAVIGFDDIRVSQYFSPALTTIRLHMDTIGEKSVHLLQRVMDGEKLADGEKIDCELIVRDSA